MTASITVTPVEVLVHWSEARAFSKREFTYSFDAFETLARGVAISADKEDGYFKTQITVKFDNGDEYTCRIDLGFGDEEGFRDHCIKMIRFAETPRGAEYYAMTGEETLNFVRRIKWPD
ncbi:hypothetical protein O3K13_06495 [Yersinia pestis]|nr:hypothetical protein [Yersinia pestis]